MSPTRDDERLDAASSETDAIATVLEPKARDVGGFTVGRLLPSAQRRAVGPFVFLDHMGPVSFAPGSGFDVPPHPHIGLSTVTYLFEGEGVHRDSLGNAQAIRPGEVNLMTAGRGIVHSERLDPELRARGIAFHGVQFWLGLPAEREQDAPTFEHHPEASLPPIAPAPAVHGRVLLGAAFGATSPILHPSRPVLVDLHLDRGASVDLPEGVDDLAVFVATGSFQLAGSAPDQGRLAVLRPRTRAHLAAATAGRVLVLGGPPVGHRFMDWNFVSSSREAISRARADWKAQTFPKIPGDDVEFVPLPT